MTIYNPYLALVDYKIQSFTYRLTYFLYDYIL